MRNIIILITILKFKSIEMDCGSPPLPHSIHIIPNGYYKENKTRYQDLSFIRYECDLNEQQLVGDSIMRCLSGRWVGTAPKCGIYSLFFD